MTKRSGFPFRIADKLDPDLVKYLDELGKLNPAGAVPDASGTASSSASAVSSVAITPVDTTASTDTTPFGYLTQAQADAIVAAINSIIVRQALIITAVNQLEADTAANAILANSLTSQFNTLLASLRTQGILGT